jgi:CHAT domain-containing protein
MIFYYKLVALGAIFKPVKYQVRVAELNAEMNYLASLFLHSKEFDIVLKITYSLQDEQPKRQILEALSKEEGIMPLTKAKAQAELASMLTLPEHKQRREELRRLAYPVLAKEHAYGALEIDFNTCYEQSMDSSKPNYDELQALINRYAELDYPNGSKSALHKCLDISLLIQNFDLQRSLEQELKKLSEETGTTLLQITGYVNLISRYHLRSGYTDLIKNTVLDIYHEISQYQLPMTQGQAANLLTNIYVEQGDAEDAQRWASICEEQWDECTEATSSMGRLQKLRSEILLLSKAESGDLASIQSLCDKYVDRDLSHKLYAEAISKLELMLSFYHTTKRIPLEKRLDCLNSLLNRTNTILSLNTFPGWSLVKANIMQQEATYLLSLGSQRVDCTMEEEAVDLLAQALQTFYIEHGKTLTYPLISTRMELGLAWYACFQKCLQSGDRRCSQALAAAEDAFAACIPGWEALGILTQLTEARYWFAIVKYEARIKQWKTSKEVLESLANAEHGFDSMRNEISISSALTAVQDKQRLTQHKHIRDVYRFAFQICVLDRDPVQAWHWVQKAKARSLSDTLGLGCIVPETLLAAIAADQEARELYEMEKCLAGKIATSSNLERFDMRVKLRDLETQMVAHASLKALLDLRYGAAVTAQQLSDRCAQAFSESHARKIVFVDWYVKGQEVFILIFKPSGEPTMRRVNTSLESIESWLANYHYSEEGRAAFLDRGENHPNQALRKMDCLIEWLEDATEPGTTMVLSPAAPLDAIPLHALHIPQQMPNGRRRLVALIERNPVVYCSNMTAFIQCCERAATKQTPKPSTSVFMAVYENTEGEESDVEERDELYEATSDLAAQMSGTSLIGQEVSRPSLECHWQAADFLYFHGHCLTKPEVITDQALVLSAAPDSDTHKSHPDPVLETVRDIFSLKLKAPHISLMACGSSSQKIEAGDEPLGLVTALLCAGASSVTGTMWPIASATARSFAEYFHAEILSARGSKITGSEKTGGQEQREGMVETAVIDLAAALRKVVIRMKRTPQTRLPYHWAAFVMHGACFMKYAG